MTSCGVTDKVCAEMNILQSRDTSQSCHSQLQSRDTSQSYHSRLQLPMSDPQSAGKREPQMNRQGSAPTSTLGPCCESLSWLSSKTIRYTNKWLCELSKEMVWELIEHLLCMNNDRDVISTIAKTNQLITTEKKILRERRHKNPSFV